MGENKIKVLSVPFNVFTSGFPFFIPFLCFNSNIFSNSHFYALHFYNQVFICRKFVMLHLKITITEYGRKL